MYIVAYVISVIVTLGYLIYMSYEDVTHNRTVPLISNYIAMGVGFVCYNVSLFIRQAPPNFFNLTLVIGLPLILWITKILGSGDAKALIAIAFMSVFSITKAGICPHDIEPSVSFGTYAFGALISFFVSYRKSRKAGRTIIEIIKGKGERIAFFPCMLAGYVITNILLILFVF